MKFRLLLPFALIAVFLLAGFIFVQPQKIDPASAVVGAWELVSINDEPQRNGEITTIRIVSESYTMFASYDEENQEFIRAGGGSYSIEGNVVTGTTDFDTGDSTAVGSSYEVSMEFPNENEMITTSENNGEKYVFKMKRVDAGGNPLTGAWRIQQIMRGDEMREIKPGPRKTIKILSGTRFQWAAINTETKQFFGTGGGTFTFKDGKYTENIEFFSRDGSKVGMSLTSDGIIDGKNWDHKGKSTKGDPKREIWVKDWRLDD